MTKSEIEQKIAISIHALRGEGDRLAKHPFPQITTFQSTPSVGRATMGGVNIFLTVLFQSTPSVGRATS